AVADGRGLLVVGLREAESRPARIDGPRDELVGVHRALGAELGKQRVVEGCRTRQIVGSNRDVANHSTSSPRMLIPWNVKLKSLSTRPEAAALPVCARTSRIKTSLRVMRCSTC